MLVDHHRSGLLVAHEAQDEQSVRRALKQFDPRLLLCREGVEDGMIVYGVRCRVNADGETRQLFNWRDETTGRPLPLSHALVDRAQRLHLGSRAPQVDVEAANQALIDRQKADDREELEYYSAELRKRLEGKSGPALPRGRYRRNTMFRDVTDVR